MKKTHVMAIGMSCFFLGFGGCLKPSFDERYRARLSGHLEASGLTVIKCEKSSLDGVYVVLKTKALSDSNRYCIGFTYHMSDSGYLLSGGIRKWPTNPYQELLADVQTEDRVEVYSFVSLNRNLKKSKLNYIDSVASDQLNILIDSIYNDVCLTDEGK